MSVIKRKQGLVSLSIAVLIVISAFAGMGSRVGALDGKGSVTSPLDFWAQDVDGDGLLNRLWVNVSFTVTVQDVFTFEYDVRDQTNVTSITMGVNESYLLPGTAVISMIIQGWEINNSAVDGPYNVDVRIYNEPFDLLDWVDGLTQVYLATDFEEMPAMANPPFGDRGFDLDIPPDGLYNQLRVNFPITCNVSGTYILSMVLMSIMIPTPISMTMMTVDAPVGDSTFVATFSGMEINASGIDGPYFVVGSIGAMTFMGPVQISQSINITQGYLASDFQVRMLILINGVVTDMFGRPVQNANLYFANYTDLVQYTATTDAFGMYTINLYRGDYVVVVNHFNYEDNATLLRVTGPGPSYDFTLFPPRPMMMVINIVALSPDSYDLTTTSMMTMQVPFLRMMFDWMLGNKDGILSQEELSLLLIGMLIGMDDTDDQFFLDDIFFYPDDYDNIAFVIDIAGPVLSPRPATMIQSAHLASNSTIPVQPYHILRANVTYDTPNERNNLTIQLPPGWIATSYDPVQNVSVGGIGTGVVTVDPLGNPNPSGIPWYVWVNITIGDPLLMPPVIVGQAAVPDPQEYMLPVEISAWVNDTSPIATVDVEITAPTAGVIGNFSMIFNATSGKYEYTLSSYPDVGTYSFAIWAEDTDGNVASGTGTFRIQDTTGPVADAGPDQNVPPGTLVTLDGSGSTDNFGIENWTWIFDDGTGPITLYGDIVTHTFNILGIYQVNLTVTDFAGILDTDNMTVTVEDPTLIPPTIEGQTAVPDPQEYEQPVLISAWVNDTSPIATVDVEVAAPVAGVIGNYSMTFNAANGKYEYTLSSYPDLGLYSFTIWAIDTDGNVASGSGTFQIQDTTNPVADAGSDKLVAPGTLVTLDGSGSTDNFGIENWTWTFDDGTGPITLYGDIVTHTFTVLGSYQVNLTVRDFSSNSDMDFLIVDVADTSIIPPTVEGQRATPDPQEFNQSVLISAWVNDTSTIATVDVEVTAPIVGVIGNFSMTYNGASGKYEYTLSDYPDLGLYSFTIWAIDTDTNIGSGSGTFLIQDTTDPIADAGPNQYIVSGTLVTLDGSGSTDIHGIDNWTWTFNDGTGAITLYGDIATHTFSIMGTFTVTLTVRDSSGNSDTDTMNVYVAFPPTPNPPTNVVAAQTALGEATVTWTAPIQNTNGSAIVGILTYNVYRSTDSAGPYTLVTTTPVTTTQFIDTGLAVDTYYYKVEAINEWGNVSDQSTPPAAVTLTNLGSVSGIIHGDGQPLADATVELLDSSGTVINSTTSGTDGSFSFSDVTPGSYTVRASMSGYDSDQRSATVTAFQNTNVGIINLVSKEEGPMDSLWLWIAIIIIVIVIILLLTLFMLKRRPKPPVEEEMPPPPPPEEEKVEEPVEATPTEEETPPST